MFEFDDLYDLNKGNTRWIIQPVIKGFQIVDSESSISLKAVFGDQMEAHEICGVLNQYEADMALLQTRLDNGHGAGTNGH